jgi:hypothetical protein
VWHAHPKRGTVWHVTERRHISIRLGGTGLEEVRRLATQETEGNASAMIRKLLAEALAARTRKAAQL